VAEQFTGFKGKYVKLEDTIASFERVLAGEFDHLPEQAFYMQGGIDDVIARAKELAGVMMRVLVISPERAVFDGEADSVVAPAYDGKVGYSSPACAVHDPSRKWDALGAERRKHQ
jgi:hypothetical protein